MSQAVKHEGLIEAPVAEVWRLLEDPARFPEWSHETLAVTGVPTKIEKGSTFEVKSRGILGTAPTTTFEVELLDDLHEIKLRCQTSGYYSHWRLTEAQGNTFTEIELGVEAFDLRSHALRPLLTKHHLRRGAEAALDGLRDLLRGRRRSAPKVESPE